MRRILFILLFAPLLSLAQNDTVHLVWLVGESNIAGMAPNASATAGELATRSNLKIWNNSTSAFESLLIGTNNNINQNVGAGTHGLELYAANAADASTLNSSSDSARYVVGWQDNATSATKEVNAVAFLYDNTSSNWQCLTVAAGAATKTATSVAVSTSNTVIFRIEATSTHVRFYLNGTLVATHTTNIPTASVSFGVTSKRRIGTAFTYSYLDKFKFK